MIITANNKTITTMIKNTWNKARRYTLIDKLPRHNEEFKASGYENAIVNHVTEVNSLVAPTTAGDPCEKYDFFRLEIKMYDVLDNEYVFFEEYVCIEK